MQIYTGVAPFTMARTAAGGYVNILAGDPVPAGVDEVDRDRLVAEGFLGYIEIPDAEVIEPVEPVEPVEPEPTRTRGRARSGD